MSVEATPAAAPAATTAPAAPPTTAAQPQTVTIPLDQLNVFTSMQARLAKIEEDRQRDSAEAARREAEALAKKGELEASFQQLRQQSETAVQTERAKLMAIEERAKRYALDGELARGLASQPLVPGGAEQLTQLWRNQFMVEPEGDTFKVRTPTFQSVGDFIGAQLGRPEYAHFLRAQNPGGGTGGASPAGQSAPTAPAAIAPPPEPRNFSEAVILQMQAMEKAKGDPRLDPKLGFGLRGIGKQG
jgi:hypothetical protein